MQKRKSVDYFLVIGILLLVVFGLIMINSVSVYDYLLTLKDPSQYTINTFALKQAILVGIGLVMFTLVSMVHYKFWRKMSLPMYIFGVFMLLLLFHPSFGRKLNGATGWLSFGAMFPSIQPIEFVKLAIVLYLARWLEPKVEELKSMENGFIPFCIIVGIVGLLVAAQPDFGGLLVIIPTTVVMFYVAGARTKHLLIVGMIGMMILFFAFSAFKHVRDRFSDFLDPTIDPSNKNVGWQIQQSLIAVGSGGFMGRGINKSIQKWGYLPEVQNDTIFAAVAEETGFRGAIALILIFLFIGWRGLLISRYAPDKFAKYTAFGISFWIIWQAFINIGVTIKILPLTGITLPFISAGGSSLLINMVSMSILVNISRYVTIPAHESFSNWRRIGGSHTS